MRGSIVLLIVVTTTACVGSSEEDSTTALSTAKDSGDVTICHVPPGNPSNAHTIEVGEAAVPAHLAHGDELGPCECTPVPEVCGDGVDNDCDGTADDGCTACTDEVCGNGLDDDCDGEVDEGCVCAPGASASCYTGPAGSEGVGACHAGVMTCTADGTGYGACAGEAGPTPEACGDGIDNDCDGITDEGCLGDRAWNDLNGNGFQDAWEVGLAGVTFVLRDGATGAALAVAVSDAAGRYFFSSVPAGHYFIELIGAPPGFGLTSPDLSGDDTLDSDFDSETGTTTVFAFDGHIDYTRDGGFRLDGAGI